MGWDEYYSVVRRRWMVVLVIVLIGVAASGFLFARTLKAAGYQGCLTLYVADVSAPSMITAPPTSIQGLGQLLAGETAANFFADDIVDVAGSQHVGSFISSRLADRRLPSSAVADLAVGGSRRDRTVNLCVTNPSAATALAAAGVLGTAMTAERSRFLGPSIGRRTFVTVISDPTVTRVPASRGLLNLALRLILGFLLAIGLALLWDALDPRVRSRQDVEHVLGVPVLASTKLP